MAPKVLFVDDDPNILEAYQRQFWKQYQIDTALAGDRGLEAVAKNGPYAVIVSDLKMPGMNGVQLLSRVREMAPDSVRIMLTGFAEVQTAIDAVNEGNIFRFLTKPCQPDVLARALDAGIEQYRLITANRELLEQSLGAWMRSEREFGLLIKNIPALVFKGYADGSIDPLDNKVEKMTGYPKSLFESRKLKWTDLILEKDIGKTKQKFLRALKGGRPYVREYRINCRDGKVLWIQERSQIVLNHIGRIDYISGVLFDISRRKRGEEALKKSLRRLRNAFRGTVKALSSTLEMRDPYTSGHQMRVTLLACAIGKKMGFSEDQLEAMRIIGSLHDIGKIAVPSEILNKPGKVNEHEFSLIKMHAEAAFNILKDIDFPCQIAEAIAQHHERLDGSGYPKGLSGPEILLQARILAVADVVEAMSSHRPYRPGLGLEAALKEITQKKGILYDPEVVDVCVRLFKEEGFTFDK